MDNKALQNQCQDAEYETKVTTFKNEKFSFIWIVNDFGAIMDRKYEFLSPVFSRKTSAGFMKWKMILRPENIYPGGTHVQLRLQKLSEDDVIYSVMYTISVRDGYGKYHVVNNREKLFRHYLDSDECLIGNNRQIKENLLENQNLTICCQLDLIVNENIDDTISMCEHSDGYLTNHAMSKDNNIPPNMQCFNDLSSSLKSKKSDSINEENLDFQIEKESSFNETKLNNCLDFARGCSKDKEDKSLEILLEDLEYLYYDKHGHDVTIYTKDGKVTAHSIILNARSNYFKKMLMNDKNEIHISTIDTFTLGVVLYHLYTGKLQNFGVEKSIDVLAACQVMNLPYLSDMVQGSIRSQININNVLKVFTLAKDIKLDNLKKCALKFIADNHDELTGTQQWKRITKNDPHSAAEILLTVASFQNKLRSDF